MLAFNSGFFSHSEIGQCFSMARFKRDDIFPLELSIENVALAIVEKS
jgi:hypothetical protein